MLKPLQFMLVVAFVLGFALKCVKQEWTWMNTTYARAEVDGQQLQSTTYRTPCAVDYVPHSSAESELVNVELEWCEAAVHRENARLKSIFADDISWLEDVGYRNKDQVLHRYMVEVQEHGWALTDVRMQIIGSVGIVSSHVHVKKTAAGRFSESDHTSVDVFEKRYGHWLLIAES